MSAQDLTEQVLREIHIMLAGCEVYDKEADEIIVNKKELIGYLKRLNICIDGLMDEYELTRQGRDAAERETRKSAEKIIQDANHKAEDVYAASVLYTDEALHRVQEIMQSAADSVKQVYDNMNQQLKKERQAVQTNQSELKGYLQDLTDTDKYLKLIEERNREIQKQKEKTEKEKREKEKKEKLSGSLTPVKPEIRINAEYFGKAGLSAEKKLSEEIPEGKNALAPVIPEVNVNLDADYFKGKEEPESVIPEVNVNLDADYFRWKEESESQPEKEKKLEKFSLFAKLLKNDN